MADQEHPDHSSLLTPFARLTRRRERMHPQKKHAAPGNDPDSVTLPERCEKPANGITVRIRMPRNALSSAMMVISGRSQP